MVISHSLGVAHVQAFRAIKQAAARGPQPVALATDATEELSRIKQELEDKNAQLQFFKEIASWGTATTADAREPAQPTCAPLSANTTPLMSNRRPVTTRAARGLQEARPANMEARQRHSFWWCRLCALMCGSMLVVAFFGCFALCEPRDSFQRSLSTLNSGGGSSAARVPAIPASAISKWWARDRNIRHGTTLQESGATASAVVTDRTRRDGEWIGERDATRESDSMTPDVAAGSTSRSGELVRQEVCSRCAAAWMLWDSASVLSLTLLNSVRITLRDLDFSVQNCMLLWKVSNSQ